MVWQKRWEEIVEGILEQPNSGALADPVATLVPFFSLVPKSKLKWLIDYIIAAGNAFPLMK